MLPWILWHFMVLSAIFCFAAAISMVCYGDDDGHIFFNLIIFFFYAFPACECVKFDEQRSSASGSSILTLQMFCIWLLNY